MTPRLFTRPGVRALRDLAARRSALVFDLDGTLAPIVRHPNDARVPASTAARLQRLSGRWPIGVVTGRAVGDAVERLGFAPRGLFGNHGAERQGSAARPPLLAFEHALDALREGLRSRVGEMRSQGIELEDKGLSLALHYRGASDPEAARVYCHQALRSHSLGLRIEDGHCVVNLMAAHAPDKGQALCELLDGWALDCALVVGDDTNDEPAFTAAPPGSVTVRIGAARPTDAQFALERQTEVEALLDLLLRLRPSTPVST